MKRLRLVSALTVTLLMSACGGADSTTPDAAADAQGATSEAGAGGTLRIGVAAGLTGFLAPYDATTTQGLELWAEEVNDEGGIDGQFPVELLIRDTGSDVAQTTVIAQELLGSDIHVLLTPCDVDPSLAAGQMAQEQQIPTFTLCSSTPTLAPAVGDFFFQSVAMDNAQAALLANYATEQGYETAYVLKSPDTAYTQLLPEYFATAFEDNGGTVLTQSTYTLGQQTFGPQVAEIESLDPDVVMTSAYEPDFPAFIRQLRSAGIETPVLGSDGLDSPTTFALGEVVEGVVFSTHGSATEGSPLEAFNERFAEHYGEPSETIFNATGYDIGLIIEEAVTQAGTLDTVAVRDEIAAIEDLELVTGVITYAGTDGVPLRSVTLAGVGSGGERNLVLQAVPDPEEIPDP